VEDLVELRFVDELKKSGFIAKLYSDGRQAGAR
jgi:hypothetical protein